MKRLALLLILAISLTATFSCKTIYTVPVEKLQTVENQIPIETSSILVVNRANREYTKTLDLIALQKYFIDNRLNGDTLIYSSQANKIATISMADALYKNDFKVVIDTLTFNEIKKSNDHNYKITPVLSSAQMLYLYSIHGIEHALVLEAMATRISTTTERANEQGDSYLLNVKGEYGVYWSFYDLKNQRKIFSLKNNDAIYWGSEGYNIKNILKQLPTFYQMNIEIAYVSGEDTAKKIIPSWTKTECVLFLIKGNEDLVLKEKAKNFKWKEIYDYYHKLLPEKRYNASLNKLYHNLAVCQEMMGNQDKALELINKSLQLKYTHQSFFYRSELLKSLNNN